MSVIVVFGYPGHGHVIPSLPIVAELVRRRERVFYFLTPEFRAAVEGTGAFFCSYGANFPLGIAKNKARFQKSTAEAIQVQLETSRWVLEHLLSEVRALKPDLAVFDALAAWGWYVANALRQSTVALYPTFAYDYRSGAGHHQESWEARLRQAARTIYQTRSWAIANELSKKYRVPKPEYLTQLMRSHGRLNLVYTSREFQPNAEAFDKAQFKFIGPSVVPRADAPAFPFEQLDGRPLILVSLGTAFNNQPSFYKACAQAFAGNGLQVAMALGANGNLAAPPNFLVQASLPQLELLGRTSVFVSHGGMNSVNESLYYNVPLVMIPQGGDHGWIAARVVELGAGVRINKTEINAERLRGAVQEILANPKYKHAASDIGATLRATGGAVQAADEILGLQQDPGL